MKLLSTLLLSLLLSASTACAATVGDNTLTIGKPGSSADVVVKLRSGCLKYNVATSKLQFANDCSTYVNLGAGLSIQTCTTTCTVLNTTDVLLCNGTAEFTATLYAANDASGKPIKAKNIGSATCNIVRAGSDTIDGDTNFIMPPGGLPQPTITFLPNGGSAWYLFD